VTPDAVLAHTWYASALALLVAVIYPLVGLWRYKKIERLPDPLPSGMRVRFYRNVILSQWTLVALTAVVMARGGHGLRALGQSWGPEVMLTLGVAGALVAGFALLSTLTLRQLARARPDELPSHARRAGRILPRTPGERAWFVGVAITAGVCEEILYRGYLPWYLGGLLGHMLLGFALATIAFGLGHAYQGRGGVIVTGVLGTFLSGVVVLTHSLVPGQLLHTMIDLVNGIALGATMVRIEAAPAPPASPPPPPPPVEPAVEPTPLI
jgi:membrane protease YdiL (CAAX protease family)